MPKKLTWDKTGERRYETGVDRGVMFPLSKGKYGEGVAWNGLTAVTESPSGGEVTALYADDIKYLNLMSTEELGLTIEAYTYPDEFRKCIGEDELIEGVFVGQQNRTHFGFCFRTKIGNDLYGNNHGYKIHIIFDCMASGSEKAYNTINDSPDAVTHSFEISTVPVNVKGKKPTANLILDSVRMSMQGAMNVMHNIENVLYGSEKEASKMPSIDDIQSIWDYSVYILDSDGNPILDGSGKKMRSMVYD